MRLGVAERTHFDGKVALALSAAELKRVRRAAASRRADSIAICLLHSYANPASEQRLARALVPMGLPLSVSHRILAEYREFERLSTTVVNAYVAPRMSSHLGRLERDLRAARLRVMQSNGSAIGARLARDEPVRTILSGPAAGVIGAAALVGATRRRSLHHFRHGRDFDRRIAVRRPCCYPHAQLSRRLRRPHSGDRHPHRGRRRRLDRRGRRRRLAQGRSRKRRRRSGASLLWTRHGADRYRREPGRGAPDGGKFSRRRDAALSRARGQAIAALSPRDAHRRDRRGQRCDPRGQRQHGTRGAGHHRRARLRPARLRTDGVRRRGPDARLRTGARSRYPPRAYCRAIPGLLCAWGALQAPLGREYSLTVRETSPDLPPARSRVRAPMLARARRELAAEGARRAQIRVELFADVRYRGQSYEIEVPLTARFAADFHAAHRRTFGYAAPDAAVEVVNLRLRAIAPGASAAPERLARTRRTVAAVADAPNPGRHRRTRSRSAGLRTRRHRRGRPDSRTRDRGRD